MKPYYETELGKLYYGDCLEIMPQLEPVDLVLTDPPYSKEFLWSYSALSEWGSKLLPDGGWCFAYGAGEHIRESLSRMDENLDYFWVFVLQHSCGNPRMWHKKLLSGYKPILVYTKGPPKTNPWMSTIHADKADKKYHMWGQGGGFALKMIDMLTEPNDVILEPFSGGGTTICICEHINRRWIGIEIEEKYCEIAAKRIENERKQLKMF